MLVCGDAGRFCALVLFVICLLGGCLRLRLFCFIMVWCRFVVCFVLCLRTCFCLWFVYLCNSVALILYCCDLLSWWFCFFVVCVILAGFGSLVVWCFFIWVFFLGVFVVV